MGHVDGVNIRDFAFLNLIVKNDIVLICFKFALYHWVISDSSVVIMNVAYWNW